jgi:hypothetical protein
LGLSPRWAATLLLLSSASAEGCSAVVVGACGDAWGAGRRSSSKRQRLLSALGLRRRAGAPAQDRKAPPRTSASYPQHPYLSLCVQRVAAERGGFEPPTPGHYWRSGLFLLLARCIKPLCHLSTRGLCYLLAPLQKLPTPMPPRSPVNQN